MPKLKTKTVAVLFDLEDTLVKTPWVNRSHVLEFRKNARNKLIELGIPQNALEGIERATLMRNKAEEYMQNHFTPAQKTRFATEMERFLKRYELDSARNSKLFPDTISTLEELKKLGLKMALVTNTSKEAADIVFRLHGIGSYFEAVFTRESVKKLKPDPDGILLAVKKLGADRFFMVGDLVHDALAAKAAGGTSIIVRRETEWETNFQADHFVQSLSEIPAIIRSRLKEMTEC